MYKTSVIIFITHHLSNNTSAFSFAPSTAASLGLSLFFVATAYLHLHNLLLFVVLFFYVDNPRPV